MDKIDINTLIKLGEKIIASGQIIDDTGLTNIDEKCKGVLQTFLITDLQS